MSDIERPWVERRRSGPPSSCPVCGAATMEVRIAGVITCRVASIDHFEWRPDEPPAVQVESERVTTGPCAACATGCHRGEPCCPHPGCDPALIDEITAPCPVHDDADNRRYDKSLTMPLPQPRPEGYSCTHTPRCRDWRDVGDPEWTATEMACGRVEIEGPDDSSFAETDLAEFYEALRPTGPLDEIIRDVKRRMDDAGHRPPVIEGEVLGRDFVETAERRLHPDAAALASLHRPVVGRPPYCWTCSSGGGQRVRVDSSRRAVWPCTTASVALAMMNLSPSDIAITEE